MDYYTRQMADEVIMDGNYLGGISALYDVKSYVSIDNTFANI